MSHFVIITELTWHKRLGSFTQNLGPKIQNPGPDTQDPVSTTQNLESRIGKFRIPCKLLFDIAHVPFQTQTVCPKKVTSLRTNFRELQKIDFSQTFSFSNQERTIYVRWKDILQ